MRSFGRAFWALGIFAAFGIAHVNAALAAAKTSPDTIASLCAADGESSAVCNCASAEFKRAADKNDYVTYTDVGKRYLASLKQGRPDMQAWDDAIGAIAIKKRITPMELAEKTETLKAKYNAAVHQCAEATAALPSPEPQKTP